MNGNLIDDKLINEVKAGQEKSLLDRRSLTVNDSQGFKKYMLEGLSEKDASRLFQGLLFASGRRCATFCLPMDSVWSVEGLDLTENKIRYREYVKKRGKSRDAVIPLLCTASDFLAALSMFHELCPPDENGMSLHGYKFRSWCRENPFFGPHTGQKHLRPCDFRAL